MAKTLEADTAAGRWKAPVGVTLLVVAIALLVYQLWPSGSSAVSDQAFYTTDNGKSYFRDSMFKVPPFDYNGASAVTAIVYRSDKGDFVGYLLRYRPEAAKLINDALAEQKAGKKSKGEVQQLMLSDRVHGGTEVAVPAASPKWQPFGSVNLRAVKGPDGSRAEIVNP